MKAFRISLIVIGAVLIFFNLISFLSGSHPEIPDKVDKASYMFGYYLGRTLLLVTGLLLFLWAYRIKKKMRRKKEAEMYDSFLNT
jgi:hypothetical protein